MKRLHIHGRVLVAVAEPESDVPIGESGFVINVDCLYAVEPTLNVVPFGHNIIVLPADVDHQLVGQLQRIVLFPPGRRSFHRLPE
jgi:hypothetical protein